MVKRTYCLSSGKLKYTNAIAKREVQKIRPSIINGPVLLSAFESKRKMEQSLRHDPV